jgi:beta-glucosidase
MPVPAHALCRAALLSFAALLSIAALPSLAALPRPVAPSVPLEDSADIENEARVLLGRLTLAEEIELLGGVDSMYTHAAPSIGLPRLKMSDASVGVRNWGPSTSYAAGVALAATWDRDYARQLGESLGGDARARGVNFLLGPGVNIARSPVAGRNFEYLSEDPFLNAALVVPYIEGVQSRGVVATVKHFALNNEEFDRHNVSADADERTMREIYLPAFEAAVREAHVDAVMNSYNLINGEHATENRFLNLDILKGEWGFAGVLMSDWDATYDTVAAVNHGLDLEMPSPRFMNAQALLPAIDQGLVQRSTIDDKVLRLLRVAVRYGFLRAAQAQAQTGAAPVDASADPTLHSTESIDARDSTYSVADRAVALRGALESLTLLKNDGALLPLDSTRIKTIAVLGPNAYPAVTGGGGSAYTPPFDTVSTLTGIANSVGSATRVLYDPGLPSRRDVFRNTRWLEPVTMATYEGTAFGGRPHVTTVSSIDNGPQDGLAQPDPTPRSIRYHARYRAELAGRYWVLATASAGNGDRLTLRLDGRPLAVPIHAEGEVPPAWPITLAAGQTIDIVADYLPRFAGVRCGFGVAFEPALVSETARRMAAAADVAVVAVGFTKDTEGEGADRTFALPWGQDALIQAVAAANARTVVTLTGGVGTDTRPWLARVPALIELYYPGQEGGTALAEILFGHHAPEGKLPVTFDRSWEDSASHAFYYPSGGAVGPGAHPHVRYADALMVGYRYWTSTGKHPFFPFGFGLSYTRFKFSDLKVPASASSKTPIDVSVAIENTGGVAAAEVAQLYVSDPSAPTLRPERELKGFARVRLEPGATQRVVFELDRRSFSYWDEKTHAWTVAPGRFVIRVGDSSEDTPVSADLHVID